MKMVDRGIQIVGNCYVDCDIVAIVPGGGAGSPYFLAIVGKISPKCRVIRQLERVRPGHATLRGCFTIPRILFDL